MPLMGSVTYRVNKFIEAFDTLIGGRKILILPRNQEPHYIYVKYGNNTLLWRSKYSVERTGRKHKYLNTTLL